ncbi:hypothetical protein, partial [Leptospira noguchii]|uniref:hypothetical protein n=1 Tax=Leptospira noguchii TaxID=28182 RepID=UPI0011478A5B
KIAVFKKCCKFAIYGILEQDQDIQIFETINPSILFMCPSSKTLLVGIKFFRKKILVESK